MEETAIEKIEPAQQHDEPERKNKSGISKKVNDGTDALSHLIDFDVQRRFDLDEKDMKIVEHLLKNLIEGHERSKASAVLGKIETDLYKVIPSSKRLVKLKRAGVIEILSETEDDTDLYGLFSSSLRISNGFLKLLFKELDPIAAEPTEANTTEFKPYSDNHEYLADQFERITLLDAADGLGNRKRKHSERESVCIDKKLSELEARILRRVENSTIRIPFEEFKKKKGLTRAEELTVLALLYCEAHPDWSNRYFNVNRLIMLIGQTPYENLKLREAFNKDGRLFKEKIVRFMGKSREEGTIVELEEHIKNILINSKGRITQKKRERKNGSIFEIVKPEISLDEVVLHPKTLDALRVVIEKIDGEAGRKIHEWGFKSNGNRHQKKTSKGHSATLLFYGPPGTGKSLTASVIANALKRELLVFDCSRILGMFMGESEKNTRRIFDEYREISKRKKRPPILLLNEADQFLHKRIAATRSTDHMYNQMQNIFLEQIENFEGVLIATTNLANSLDPAFSRRFDHKIEFKRPGMVERLKLWQKHIPHKTPLSEDVKLEYLASTYDLSGGQISLVVKNAAVSAAMNADKIHMGDFIRACEDEIKGNFDEYARQNVGF